MTPEPAIIVHGGAGQASEEDPAPHREGVARAAQAGWDVLKRGGSAVDAVEAAVRALEDDPTFNAGTGACLTLAGDVEMDASIMDGATLAAGAVAIVKDVKNPVSLARKVMEQTPHVLLAGPATSDFARKVGIPAVQNGALVTERQRKRWEAMEKEPGHSSHPPSAKFGTVGAVARDARGHLAAATSTGGMRMKMPGRVGDTPILGAGTYADDRLAAVSCTGHGERIMQVTLARHCADLVARGMGAREAAREAIGYMQERVQGEGGLIVLGPSGDPGSAHNSPVMSRAWSKGGKIVAEL